MSETIITLTNFIFLNDPEEKADLIIVPGSSHKQLPQKAAQLFKKNLAKKIIFTGGFNPKLGEIEAEWCAKIALKSGIPKNKILLEKVATNTKENAIETFKLIRKGRLPFQKLVLVTKPYHARRVKMTFAKVFPNSRLLIIPVNDDRNITHNNWYKDKKKIYKIMEELGKISQYYLKGDLKLD